MEDDTQAQAALQAWAAAGSDAAPGVCERETGFQAGEVLAAPAAALSAAETAAPPAAPLASAGVATERAETVASRALHRTLDCKKPKFKVDAKRAAPSAAKARRERRFDCWHFFGTSPAPASWGRPNSPPRAREAIPRHWKPGRGLG